MKFLFLFSHPFRLQKRLVFIMHFPALTCLYMYPYILGWRPRRTILFASWDAEEYGLLGSTEWAEASW